MALLGAKNMKFKHSLRSILLSALLVACFGLFLQKSPVFAAPTTDETIVSDNSSATEADSEESSETTPNPEELEENAEKSNNSCYDQTGALGWLVCPTTGLFAKAIDGIYGIIEDFLVVKPISTDQTSPIYLVWNYARDITNIVFIIFIIIIIYSQLTGIGISNYSIKKTLPRIIVSAILVNLSFIICSLAVDLSNIIGASLGGVFSSIEETTLASSTISDVADISWTSLVGAFLGGTTIAGISIGVAGGLMSFIWMLIPTVIGAIISIVIGLLTISARQALVSLLIMVSPLAFVAYLLPNTEKWFAKWKDLLLKMLIFYPMFSCLFGGAKLAGWVVISSASGPFELILGMAIQIIPLFLAFNLMKMSGTILNSMHNGLSRAFSPAQNKVADFSSARRAHAQEKYRANSAMPSAKLRRYLDYRQKLLNDDTDSLKQINAANTNSRVQRKISSKYDPSDKDKPIYANSYTRNAKRAKNATLASQTANLDTDHVLDNYSDFFNHGSKLDHALKRDIKSRDKSYLDAINNKTISEKSGVSKLSKDARLNYTAGRNFFDLNRAMKTREIDEENDIDFLTSKYLEANKRDKNNKPIDETAYNRYIKSMVGDSGDERVLAKVIAQAAKVESKQRAEYSILQNKFGHNGDNKSTFRSWISGYQVNDEGWAIDKNGKRLYELNADGSIKKDAKGKPIYLESVHGQALTKAPERIVVYDKRDSQGIYYDMKDQDGNIVARIHRGKGDDGVNHDDGAFIKETLANYDIPIGDPINDVYSILAGIRPGDIKTKEPNEIGLARYSTTIGRGLSAYKGNAAWAGTMYSQMVNNRQIHNSAQMAIDICDSIIKTSKPGALNTQNPASIAQLRTILDPRNWADIFREEDINGCNINNSMWGGEDWQLDDKGNIIGYTSVENPNYEQRMNTLKRKYLFPAMSKIVPSIIRNTSPNTVDNQKPGAADEWSQFIDMIESQWTNIEGIPDPNIRQYDLLNQTLNLKAAQRDKNGNPIYPNIKKRRASTTPTTQNINPLVALRDIYLRSLDLHELINNILCFLSENGYDEALSAFDDYVSTESPTMEEIEDFIENNLSSFFA